MKLELETTTTSTEKGETEVSASLRNVGREDVTVLLEPQLSGAYARLTDEGGKELEANDARAAQGSRAFEFGKIACVLVIPWALVFGEVRGIPMYWRLIDCSFGVIGYGPMWLCMKWVHALEAEQGVRGKVSAD